MWLVIGIGNPLRGDDGVGRQVAERIAEARRDVRVRVVHQLTPELAVELAEHSDVVFVDADRSGATTVDLTPIVADASAMRWGHTLLPETLLTYVGALTGPVPRAWRLAVPGVEFDFGERLSPTASAGREEALRRLDALIDAK